MDWTAKTTGFCFMVVIALLGSSCSRPPEISFPEPERFADSKAGELVSQAGELTVGDRSYDTEACMLTVPENRKGDGRNLLHLPVLRVRSKSTEKRPPVFRLSGGPGMPNVPHHAPAWLLEHHDVVFVGYRGVEGSTSLDCPEVTEMFSAIGDPLSEENIKLVGDAYLEGFERLRQEGVDLNSYTMLDVIDDFEAARRALGYEKIHLYSQSYGTRVAYLYGLRYPDSVARSVMVAVNPPGHFIWEPEVNEDIFKQYCERWNNDPVASARCADIESAIDRVFDELPQTWVAFEIDPNKLRCMMFFMMYQNGSTAQMLDAFVAADQGDYSGLALMCFMFDDMIAGAVNWGDNAAKAMSADFDPSRDYLNEMMPRDSVIGSPFSKVVGFMMQDRQWPIQPIPAEFRRLRTSEVETLMVNGNVDISTPARFARDELLPHLPNGDLVVLSDMGHGDVVHLQAEAFQHLASTYFLTGEVDDSKFEHQAVDFTSVGVLPQQAKKYLAIAVGSVAGSLLVVVAVAWLGWRRLRRHRKSNRVAGVAAPVAA